MSVSLYLEVVLDPYLNVSRNLVYDFFTNMLQIEMHLEIGV
jgi:hypothetical protein